MCPICGGASARRVRWTPWGGFLGPLVFQLMRCQMCGGRFGGRSRLPEARVIKRYLHTVAPVVMVVCFVLLCGLAVWWDL